MTSRFTIKKYDCTSCAMLIEGIMEDTEGVTKATVHPAKKILEVEHNESVDPNALVEALTTEGYPVEPLF